MEDELTQHTAEIYRRVLNVRFGSQAILDQVCWLDPNKSNSDVYRNNCILLHLAIATTAAADSFLSAYPSLVTTVSEPQSPTRGSKGRGFELRRSADDLQEILQLWLFGRFTSCVSLSE